MLVRVSALGSGRSARRRVIVWTVDMLVDSIRIVLLATVLREKMFFLGMVGWLVAALGPRSEKVLLLRGL